MKLIGVCRLGRDAELRYASTGMPVANFSGAYDHGRKGEDGRRPTQWVECAIWGDRAEKLMPYLLKGQQVFVCGDAHVETYERRDSGTGVKLVVRVDDLTLCGSRQDGGGAQEGAATAPTRDYSQAQATTQQRPAATRAPSKFDDLEDDIPF